MLKATLIGHLGNDAEVREFGDRKVISFNVAHNERFRDRETQQWRDRTVWVRCSYWRDPDRLAVLPYLTKGRQVFAEGTLTVGSYTNQEGQVIPTIDLRVNDLQLLGSATGPTAHGGHAAAASGSTGGGSATAYAQVPQVAHTVAEPLHAEDFAPEDDDDLPF